MNIDDIIIRIAADVGRARRDLQDLDGSLSSTGKAAAKAAKAMAALASAAIGGSVISDLIRIKDEAVRLETAYRMIFATTEQAASALQFVASVANTAGVAVDETAKAFQSIAAASKGTALEGQATRDIFKTVTLTMAKLGKDTFDTTGALKALEQMMSKGNVQAEELRGQLGERLPGAFSIAARAMGVTAFQLGKMMELGQVTAEEMLPKLRNELERMYGSSAVAETVAADFERLKNTLSGPDGLGVAINDALGLNDKLSASLQNVTASVNELNTEIRDGTIQNDWSAWAETLESAGGMAQSLYSNLRGVMVGSGASATPIDDLASAWNGVGDAFAWSVEQTKEMPDTLAGVTYAVAANVEILKAQADAVMSAANGDKEKMKNLAAYTAQLRAIRLEMIALTAAERDRVRSWDQESSRVFQEMDAFNGAVSGGGQASDDATNERKLRTYDALLAKYDAESKAKQQLAADQQTLNDLEGAVPQAEIAALREKMIAATNEKAAATDNLTKSQRENNAEMGQYVARAGKVLGLSEQQRNVMMETLPAIQAASKSFGVPQDVIMSIIDVESAWKKAAYNSKASATGMMQIIPATARLIARETGLAFEDIMTKPAVNIEAGTYLIGKLIAKYGDLETALRAYNAGEGNRLKASYGWKETNGYVVDVASNMKKLGPIGAGAADFFSAIRDDAEDGAKKASELAQAVDQINAQKNARWDQLAESYDTQYAAEKRQKESLQEIHQLYKTGRMTADEYARALKGINAEYQGSQGPMEQYLDGLRDGMGSLETLAVDAMEGFNNAIVDGLIDGRFEFDDFADDIKRTLAKMAVDTIVLRFAGQIMGVFGGGATGAAGTALQAVGGGGTSGYLSQALSLYGAYDKASNIYGGISGGGALSTLSGATYGTGFGTQQSAMLAAQDVGVSGGSWSGGGAGSLVNMGAGLAGGVAGSYLAGQMFDGQYVSTGSSVGGMGGAYLGATYGSAFGPIGTAAGALIGAIAGGAIASMFGDSTPRQGHFSTSFSGKGFEDNASAAGAFGLKFGLADKGTKNVKAAEFQGAFDGMAQVSQMLAEFYGADLSAKIQASLVATVPDLNQWGKNLNGAFDAIFSGILWHADAVEGATGDGLGHLLSIAVGDLYGTADEMTAQLQSGMAVVRTVTALYGTEIGRLAGMADGAEFGSLEASVNAMKAYVSSFARGGETVAMTTERLIVGIASFSQALAMTGVQLDAVTKSGFDFVWMAQRFPDALAYFGFTLDSLMQTQSAYYDHFWTEEEKAIKQRDASLAAINAWSESIGQAGDAAIDTSAEFRDYIESLDLLDLAQQDAYLRAMQLVPAFVAMDAALATLEGAAGDAGDAVEDLAETLADFIASLKPKSQTNNESLAQMVALFGEWGLQMPASSESLYALIQAGALTEAQMQALADRSETLGEAFAGLAARQSAALALLKTSYDNAVSGATDASNARLDALRAGSTANEDALRAAYDLAVDAATAGNSLNTETLQTQLTDLSDNFSDFERVVDAATDALRSLAEQGDGIDETRQRYLQEARDAIAQFQSTGAFPNTVTDTLGGLGTVDPNDFATRDDWQAAIAENAAVVTQLRNLGAVQQSDSEIQIDLLEDQIEQAQHAHDDLLKRLSANLDADLKAERANLDRLIRAEEAALRAELADLSDRFADAQAALMTDTNLILNTGNGLLQQLLDSLQTAGSPSGFDESYYLTQNPDVRSAVDAGTFSSGLDHYLNYGADEGRDGNLGTAAQFNELSYLQHNADVAAAVASGMFESGWQHYLLHGIGEKRLPSYATGGLHPGGWRRVGEDGPELEFTGPSAILPSQMTRQMMAGDSGTKEEVSALRQEVRSLNATIASLLKIHRRWDGEGLPPDKMDYAKTVAEAML